MPRPLLPPLGVNVPTPLIYSAAVSAPVLRTWIQLRSLAWEQPRTPQFQMLEFAHFVSKSPSTIYGHMAVLRSLGALRWRSYNNGTLTVSFPTQEMQALPAFQDSGILESASFKDLIKTNNNIYIKRESPFLESKKLNKNPLQIEDTPAGLDPGQARFDNKPVGMDEKLEDHDQKTAALDIYQSKISNSPAELDFNKAQLDYSPAELDYSPIGIYRSLMKVKPNQIQRAAILERVMDFDLWYACLEHWLSHKWSKVNIPGMLDLYQRGGPGHCRYCRGGENKSQSEIIQELREEGVHGES